MKKITINFTLLFLLLPSLVMGASFKELKKDYGVEVVYDFRPRRVFPRVWFSRHKGSFISLKEKEARQLKRTLQNFLISYPDSFMRENLKKIYLLEYLSFYNKRFGASYDYDGLLILLKYEPHRESKKYILRQLHHEFSSILLKKHHFNSGRWAGHNGSHYISSRGGTNWLGQRGLRNSSRKLLKDGFLQVYSRSSYENDFNIYAEYLFARYNELVRLSKRYPKVAAKSKMIEDFYCNLDNRFVFCSQ